MKHKYAAALAIVLVLLSGCVPSDAAPKPSSDSSQAYEESARIPVDDNVYLVRGQVAGDVSSLTRQTQAAYGSMSGTMVGSAAVSSGAYFGAQFGGKGFVRLYVLSIEPKTEAVSAEDIAIIKTSDTKAVALLPGDIVTFKCRLQYEAVAAVRKYESWDDAKSALVETWELDYCRLAVPAITVPVLAED